MKIGYPCSNLSLQTKCASTFRLAGYSEERLFETVGSNLDGLEEILRFNVEHGLLFFRLSSGLVPFGGHKINVADWRGHFKKRFETIGNYLREHSFRISMHPGQYVLLNSPRPEVAEAGVADLAYHADLLDLLGLDRTAKLQIHVGGTYGDKAAAMERFEEGYRKLPEAIGRRLCVENDERQYGLEDCLELNRRCGVPVIFDSFHHSLYGGASLPEAVRAAAATWKGEDGILMLDYSTQDGLKQAGAHTDRLEEGPFRQFLAETGGLDFDLMLEIKNKEGAAIPALTLAREAGRVR